MTHGLASVFVNNQRVEDLDEPRLTIGDIVRAYGRDPQRSLVYRLESEDDTEGERVGLDEPVDLGSLGPELHLRCETRRTEASAPSPFNAESLPVIDRVPAYEPPIESATDRDAEVAWAAGAVRTPTRQRNSARRSASTQGSRRRANVANRRGVRRTTRRRTK